MKLKNCKPGVRVEVKNIPNTLLAGKCGVVDTVSAQPCLWPVAVDLGGALGLMHFGPEELRRLTPKVGDRVRILPSARSFYAGMEGSIKNVELDFYPFAVDLGEGIVLWYRESEMERIR